MQKMEVTNLGFTRITTSQVKRNSEPSASQHIVLLKESLSIGAWPGACKQKNGVCPNAGLCHPSPSVNASTYGRSRFRIMHTMTFPEERPVNASILLGKYLPSTANAARKPRDSVHITLLGLALPYVTLHLPVARPKQPLLVHTSDGSPMV